MTYNTNKFEMRDCHGICGLPSLLWQKVDKGAFGRVKPDGTPTDGPIYDLAVDSSHWMELVKNKGVVVQAGGNQGMYPRFYADHFDKVYTFEPDEDNYFCLDYNCQGDKYHKQRAGLGSRNGTISLVHVSRNNTGMHRTIDGDAPNSIKVDLITLDSLDIEGCDLLHLDVELYETQALMGAEKTIQKYAPVIVVETGGRKSPADDYFRQLGYKMHSQLRMDAIYVKE